MKKITVKRTVNRQESYIPKGCRKPRTRLVEEEVTLSIGSAEESEAPVAFVCHEFKRDYSVRLYRGRLYVQEMDHDAGVWTPRRFTEGMLQLTTDYGWKDYVSPEAEQRQREELARRLVIGGMVYHQCGQPYYSWNTFGIGCSWCFSICFADRDYEARGISPDDREMLQAKFDEMNPFWRHEYEYRSLEEALRYNSIEVVMPECCRLKFRYPIDERDIWEKENVDEELRKDVLAFVKRMRKKCEKHFHYLSAEDFEDHLDRACKHACWEMKTIK